VNQLITLASEARHGLWVISDSNVRVAPGYLLFVAWCHGLLSRTVDWRGNRLRVLPGTRLVPVEAKVPLALEPSEAGAGEELLAG
jgi:hypothetical protein